MFKINFNFREIFSYFRVCYTGPFLYLAYPKQLNVYMSKSFLTYLKFEKLEKFQIKKALALYKRNQSFGIP